MSKSDSMCVCVCVCVYIYIFFFHKALSESELGLFPEDNGSLFFFFFLIEVCEALGTSMSKYEGSSSSPEQYPAQFLLREDL